MSNPLSGKSVSESVVREADHALFGLTLLMQESVMRAAVELVERYPHLRESQQGFQVSIEEFVTDFCREVGDVTEGRARDIVQGRS